MYRKEYSWLNDIIDAGYKYIVMPTRRSKTFYATKAEQTKDGQFRSNSNFDEYYLTKDESWFGDKGVYIRL